MTTVITHHNRDEIILLYQIKKSTTMFTNNISQALTGAQKTAMQAAVTTLTGIFTWFLNLTAADRKKILKLGEKSEQFVRAVLDALENNPSAAGTLDLVEFRKDLTLWDDLRQFSMLLTPFYEGLQDSIMLLGNELMSQANSGYGFIKEAAKTNAALTTVASDLGKRYEKGGRGLANAFTLGPGGTNTLNGIVPLRQIKILVGSSVTIYKGANAVGTSKVVGIGTPIKVPAGWTTLTAVNNDATNPCVFTIMQS
jgi:hypothetical protein